LVDEVGEKVVGECMDMSSRDQMDASQKISSLVEREDNIVRPCASF